MNALSGIPGFLTLYCTFQDQQNLYFAMTYAKNGDFLPYINKVGSFDLDCTRHYAAELVLAIENMHKRGVIHRDLKPENILLDDKMHTMIADFGSAKFVEDDDSVPVNIHRQIEEERLDDERKQQERDRLDEQRRLNGTKSNPANSRFRGRKNSFVGTAQYVSPELLRGMKTTKSADLWALGCIIYQMISGLPPFRAQSEYLIFQNVLKAELDFPDGFDECAKDLVKQILHLEPEQRLGASDTINGTTYTSIRSHEFFKGIDWKRLHKKTPPQIYPYLPGDELRSQYRVPDHLEPGLDNKQLQRLLGIELGTANVGDDCDKPVNSNKS